MAPSFNLVSEIKEHSGRLLAFPFETSQQTGKEQGSPKCSPSLSLGKGLGGGEPGLT